MPELPEVETIRLGLRPWFEGLRIEGLELRAPSLRYPLDPALPARLSGRTVRALDRRGKYMLMHLEGGGGLVIHLGMSGRFITCAGPGGPEAGRHDHVIFKMPQDRRVLYHDPRRFGFVQFFEGTDWQSLSPFDRMGPEPLSEDFSGAVLRVALKGRKAPIKQALLDQDVVAGVGNIYACEALHAARIHPQVQAGALSAANCDVLTDAVKAVLNRALQAGGSTLRDYKQPGGAPGYFQHVFSVYDRAGQPCRQCARPDKDAINQKSVIQRIAQGGRSSFFCPVCQRKPGGKRASA